MNKKIIIANWKMNPVTLKEAQALFSAVQKGVVGVKNVEIVICPPFVYLENFKKSSAIKLGAQNCYFEEKGTYTGEVSPPMLRDIGCEYVIVGHSERKRYFGETNETINKKLKAALKAGLGVILCVGEDSRDSFDSSGRWTNELDPVLKEQIEKALLGVSKSQISKILIVYEPVWAIGSGQTITQNAARPDDVFSAKIFIKKVIADIYSRKEADKIRILYGGSTDRKNAKGFVEEGQIDGLLVGGSSIKADEFIAMIKEISSLNEDS